MRRHVRWLDFATLTQRPYFKGALGQEVAGTGPPMSPRQTRRPPQEASAEAPTEPPEPLLRLRPLSLPGRCVRTTAGNISPPLGHMLGGSWGINLEALMPRGWSPPALLVAPAGLKGLFRVPLVWGINSSRL